MHPRVDQKQVQVAVTDDLEGDVDASVPRVLGPRHLSHGQRSLIEYPLSVEIHDGGLTRPGAPGLLAAQTIGWSTVRFTDGSQRQKAARMHR